jgi:hypothetical protein
MSLETDRATDFGVDPSLIEERLALTPTERWHRHAQALVFVRLLRAAARAQRFPRDTAPPAR